MVGAISLHPEAGWCEPGLWFVFGGLPLARQEQQDGMFIGTQHTRPNAMGSGSVHQEVDVVVHPSVGPLQAEIPFDCTK